MTLISPQRSWSSAPGTRSLMNCRSMRLTMPTSSMRDSGIGEELGVQRGAVAILAAVVELGEVGGDRLRDVAGNAQVERVRQRP